MNLDEEIYTDIGVKGSDHRPVFGRFVVNILKETRKNSQSIILEESYLEEDSIEDNIEFQEEFLQEYGNNS